MAAEDWDGDNGFRSWIAPIDGKGNAVWSKRYTCTDSGNMALHPQTTVLTAGWNIVVAGRTGGCLRSFLLALKPDGTAAWMTVPWSGSDLSYLINHSVQEHPTTGFVVAGSYMKDYDPDVVFIAGAEPNGHVQWAQGYQVTAGDSVESNIPAIRLTDDGGVFQSAYTRYPDASPGSIWAMKTYAEDGAITFNAAAARMRAVPFDTATCSLSTTTVTPEVKNFSVTLTAVNVQVSDRAPVLGRQTP